MDLKELLRPNIRALKPYSAIRDGVDVKGSLLLDSNENYQAFVPWKQRNRYPDAQSKALRRQMERVMHLPFENTVIGNGSSEIMDNLIRSFCVPGEDSVVVLVPSFYIYRRYALINDVAVREVPLDAQFDIDFEKLNACLDSLKSEKGPGRAKMLFLQSPNDPSGRSYPIETIEKVVESFDGIVVVDEAFWDFSSRVSAVTLLKRYRNLVVLRTLSNAWGLAGGRIGVMVADPLVCEVIRKVAYHYNVSTHNQYLGIQNLHEVKRVKEGVLEIMNQKSRLVYALGEMSFVKHVYESDANFLLVKVEDAEKLVEYLKSLNILIANLSGEIHCDNCVRITIGHEDEISLLIESLRKFDK